MRYLSNISLRQVQGIKTYSLTNIIGHTRIKLRYRYRNYWIDRDWLDRSGRYWSTMSRVAEIGLRGFLDRPVG